MEDTTYYWRSRVTDGVFSSDWTLSSFLYNEVDSAPTAPIAITPTGDVFVVNPTPTLTVSNAVDPEGSEVTYLFELWADRAEGELLLSVEGVPQGAEQTSLYLEEELQRGESYTWNAYAVDASGNRSSSSTPATFRVYEKPEEGWMGCRLVISSPTKNPTPHRRALTLLMVLSAISFLRLRQRTRSGGRAINDPR